MGKKDEYRFNLRLEKSLQEDHFVNLEGDCKADEAEVLLIKNNYKMFEDLE